MYAKFYIKFVRDREGQRANGENTVRNIGRREAEGWRRGGSEAEGWRRRGTDGGRESVVVTHINGPQTGDKIQNDLEINVVNVTCEKNWQQAIQELAPSKFRLEVERTAFESR